MISLTWVKQEQDALQKLSLNYLLRAKVSLVPRTVLGTVEVYLEERQVRPRLQRQDLLQMGVRLSPFRAGKWH